MWYAVIIMTAQVWFLGDLSKEMQRSDQGRSCSLLIDASSYISCFGNSFAKEDAYHFGFWVCHQQTGT